MNTQQIEQANRPELKAYLVANGVVPAQLTSDLKLQALAIADKTPAPAQEQTPAPAQEPTPAPAQEQTPAPAQEQTPQAPTLAADLLAQAMTLLSQGQKQALDETRVKELIDQHSKVTTVKILDLVQDKEREVKSAHPKLPELLKQIKTAKITNNVPYMWGEAGTGKTTLAKQAAEALDLPFYFSGSTYDIYSLIGFKDAASNYQETDFFRAYTTGGIFLYDELDDYSSEVLVSLNASWENGYCAFPLGIEYKHPNFIPIAAGNTDGRGSDSHIYHRKVLDGSTLDRLRHIPLKLDFDLAVRVAKEAAQLCCQVHETKHSEQKFDKIYQVWKQAREYAQCNELPLVVGLRDLRKLAVAHISEDLSLEYAYQQTSIANFTLDQRIQAGF